MAGTDEPMKGESAWHRLRSLTVGPRSGPRLWLIRFGADFATAIAESREEWLREKWLAPIALLSTRRAPDSNPNDAGSLWHRRLANLDFLAFFAIFLPDLSVLGSVSRLIHWAIVAMARR